MKKKSNLTLLGKSGITKPTALLEKFPKPARVEHVQMVSDEVTAQCPVTGQPDFYKVEISYTPRHFCIESKSLKLKLQSYKNQGIFCENLSTELANHIMDSISPLTVSVSVTQKSRGGISITATSYVSSFDDE